MNNLNSTFLQAVETYVKSISGQESVIAVVLTGSAGRGDFDQYSDIDNVVFVNGEHKVREGKFVLNGFLFDTRIVDINKIMKSEWSDYMYFAYINAKIVYDPRNIITDLICEKKRCWDLLIEHEISLSLVNLSVIYTFEDNWKGLKTETHYNKFLKRKDYLSAHRLLNAGFEIILDICYLTQRESVPDYKNKMRLLHRITNLPTNITTLLSEGFCVRSYDEKDLSKRYEVLSELINLIRHHIETLKIELPDDLYKYYLLKRV